MEQGDKKTFTATIHVPVHRFHLIATSDNNCVSFVQFCTDQALSLTSLNSRRNE
jgi:hypothetical protein